MYLDDSCGSLRWTSEMSATQNNEEAEPLSPDKVQQQRRFSTGHNKQDLSVPPMPFSSRVRLPRTSEEESDLPGSVFHINWDDEHSSSLGSSVPTRSVHFDFAVKVYRIINIDSYTDEEYDRCWYSTQERDRLSIKREKIIVRMDAGKPQKRNQPYRGLEYWSEEGYNQMEQRVSHLMNSVMNEQDRQLEANISDADRLAAISQELSGISIYNARQIGIHDEYDANHVYATWTSAANACDANDDSTVGSVESHVARKRRDDRRKRRAARGGKRDATTEDEPVSNTSKLQRRARRSGSKREQVKEKEPIKSKASSSSSSSTKSKQVKGKKVKRDVAVVSDDDSKASTKKKSRRSSKSEKSTKKEKKTDKQKEKKSRPSSKVVETTRKSSKKKSISQKEAVKTAKRRQ